MLPAIPPAAPFHSRTVESFPPLFEPRCDVEPGQSLLLPVPKALALLCTLDAEGRGEFFGLVHLSDKFQKDKHCFKGGPFI